MLRQTPIKPAPFQATIFATKLYVHRRGEAGYPPPQCFTPRTGSAGVYMWWLGTVYEQTNTRANVAYQSLWKMFLGIQQGVLLTNVYCQAAAQRYASDQAHLTAAEYYAL